MVYPSICMDFRFSRYATKTVDIIASATRSTDFKRSNIIALGKGAQYEGEPQDELV